jgi:hypothetical protein
VGGSLGGGIRSSRCGGDIWQVANRGFLPVSEQGHGTSTCDASSPSPTSTRLDRDTSRALDSSRGVDTYGAASAANVWANYEAYLRFYTRYPFLDTIAWPDGCNQIDLLHHPLWSNVPYIKGALFLRAVEQRVGRAAFDQAIAVFYLWHVGKAASMGDLVDTVEWLTHSQLDDLVDGYLKHLGGPTPTPAPQAENIDEANDT